MHRLSLSLLCPLIPIFPCILFAIPQSPEVISGHLEMSLQSPEVLELIVSDKSIIDWNEFSIESQETVQFLQPSEQACSINRVMNSLPSQLMGRLESNGKIVLINPNGILVGNEAQIHTGSFIASSLDVNQEVFLSTGELKFCGNGNGLVKNEGLIQGQDIFLIGKLVENQGSILAQKSCGLAAAQTVELGNLKTSGSESTFLRNGGMIEGESIWLLGDYIHIQESSHLSADQKNGGGSIWIGGDFQGKNSSIKNASMLYIEPNAVISASALEQGDGGRVILWSDQETSFYGSVLAKGATGSGGFAEISGGQSLIFQGRYDGSSMNGERGELLLDPNDIFIGALVTSGGPFPNTGTCFDGTTPIGLCHPASVGSQPANLNAGELQASLMMGNNVTVQTNPTAAGGTGNITLNAGSPISWTVGSSLTLSAVNDIFINDSIQQSAATVCPAQNALVILNAGRNIQINASAPQTSVGSQNDGTQVVAGGTITLTGGAALNRSSQIGFYTPTGGTSSGSIYVSAGGDLTMTGGSAQGTGTQIGHGQVNSSALPPPGVDVGTTATATIEVISGGNIAMSGGTGLRAETFIGHGAFQLQGPNTFERGDITVICAGNLTMKVQGLSAHCDIGHGCGGSNGAVASPGADIQLLSGNIGVFVGNDLLMNRAAGSNSAAMGIGHYQQISGGPLPGKVDQVQGNIEIGVGRDLILNDFAASNGAVFVGHNVSAQGGTTIFGPLVQRVVTGRDLIINKAQNGFNFAIGYASVLSANSFTQFTLILEINRNFTLTSTANASGTVSMGGNGISGFSTGNVYAVVRGDVSFQCNETFRFIAAAGTVAFATLGNFSLFGNPTLATNAFFLPGSPDNPDVHFYVGKNFTLTPSANLPIIFFNQPFGFDLRVGGSINGMPNGVVTVAGQSINIQAAHDFAAGEFFTTSGAFPNYYATICGQSLAVPIAQFSTACLHYPCACVCACPCISTSNPQAYFQCGGAALNCNTTMCLYNNPQANADSAVLTSAGGTLTILGTGRNFFTTGGLTMTASCIGTTQTVTIGAGAANTFNIGGLPSSINVGPFGSITVNETLSIAGPITFLACDDLTINNPLTSTTLTDAITLGSDVDLNGTGTLTINASITKTKKGPINLSAGFGAAAGATSSINQTAGTISSAGGDVSALAASNITFSGATPTTVNTGGGALTSTSSFGTILFDENILTGGGAATFTAGQDILVNPTGGKGSLTTAGGALSMIANNNITINGDALSLSSAAGNMTLIADADNTGVGNLLIQQSILTSTGNICLEAGPGTFGCSQNNCHSGLISGFPIGNCTVTVSAPVSSTSGSITVTSAVDILVNNTITTSGPIALTAGLGNLTVNQQIKTTGGTIFTFAGKNTTLTQPAALLPPNALISAAAEIRMITGLNMTVGLNTAILSSLPGGEVTLIVDNIHPFFIQPPFPSSVSGSLTMLAGSSATSGSPLRIFTAYSQVFGVGPGMNFLDPSVLLNGQSPAAFGYPGPPFTDTATEQWCVFFGCPANYPFPTLGVPFTFFYKNCLQQLVVEAQLVTTEFLLDLHPFNEFPGWQEEFYLHYRGSTNSNSDSSLTSLPSEPFYITHRHLHPINIPKTYTTIVNDTYLERDREGNLRFSD